MRARLIFAIAAFLCGGAAADTIPNTMIQDVDWRLVGPHRGGWATVIDGVADKPDVFLIGTAGGGIWRTENAGRTWQPVFGDGAPAIGALTIAPSDGQIVYAGSGQAEPRYDVAGGQGAYKSVDGGLHWQQIGLEDTRQIGRIWVDPQNPDTVLVGAIGHFFGPGGRRGLFRSTDGGKNWAQVLDIDKSTGIVDIASAPGENRELFAASWQIRLLPWLSYYQLPGGPGSALYHSSDGGQSWTKLNGEGWPQSPLGRISLAAARVAGGALRLYAVVDGRDASGLYRSDDGGAHWQRVNKQRNFTSYYASRILIAPEDPDVVYLVGQSVRRCVKGGETCEIIKGAPGGDDYHQVWINPRHRDHIAVASDQGAVISVDGGKTWSSWYNQPTGQFYHLETDRRFPYWIYSAQQDSGSVAIASRSDYGAIGVRDWHPVGAEERDCVIPDPADPQIVYGSGLGGKITRYDARTGQVQEITPWPVPNYGRRETTTKYHFPWITQLAVSKAGPPALYLGAQVLFKTADRGRHWSVISPDLTGKRAGAADCDGDVRIEAASACGYGSIFVISPSPRHADEIWVGTDNGHIQLTRDGGAHWRDVAPPMLPEFSKIAGLDVSAIEDRTAYAAIDNQRLDDQAPHLFRTRDYGAHWQDVSVGLPAGRFVSAVRSDPARADLVFAGTEDGVFVSFDRGDHWQSLGAALPRAWIRDLAIHDGDLIAATQGRAIWIYGGLDLLRQVQPKIGAEDIHLFQPALAYRVHPNNNKDTPLPPDEPMVPNPPGGAAIDYWLKTKVADDVVLEIRDASGRLIRRLSERPPEPVAAEVYFAKEWVGAPTILSGEAGHHRIYWDLRGARPPAQRYRYSIAAVVGASATAQPAGPYVPPGDYRITLRTGNHTQEATLTLRKDPRVTASDADLAASYALSQRIAADLALETRAQGEANAVLRQLESLKHPDLAGEIDALKAQIKPAEGDEAVTFAAIDEILAGIEADLEGADAAPTAAQTETVAEAEGHLKKLMADWSALRDGKLAELDRKLTAAGAKAIEIPAHPEREAGSEDDGEDLP